MADIVNYKEQSGTIRSQTSSTSTEVSELTVAWEDLTGAGIWTWSQAHNSDIATSKVEIREGSTFAGASIAKTFISEPDATLNLEGGVQMMHLDRITLTSGNDFYIGLSSSDNTNAAKIGNWSFVVLKLDDLTENTDFFYNENTTDEQPGASYTSYASVTLPAGGGDDWLVLGSVFMDVSTSTTSQFNSRLSLGGTGRMETAHAAEVDTEFYGIGLIGYLAAAGASAVCAVQCQNAGINTHAHESSVIFALRMEAFTDHSGNMDQDVVAASGSSDTFVECNTVTHTASATGDCFYFGQSIADIADNGMQVYPRIQDDGTDMHAAGLFNDAISSRNAADQLGPLAFGISSVASGSNTIDLDCANRFVGAAFNFDEHALVVFSADLAPAGGPISILVDPAGTPY
jgi:hypothetical protein